MNRRKISFILFIALLLIASFSTTSFISYKVANDALEQQIYTDALPLTSDNVYSEIQRDILPTIVLSSLMAHDTFVYDWVGSGEEDEQKIIRYLKTIQQRFQTTTAFFVSESSRSYYHPSGKLKQVKQHDPADAWYFRVRAMNSDYEINIDTDTADLYSTNVFVNHKVINGEGTFLGAIGVGLSSEVVNNMIEMYQTRYERQVYLVDKSGQIKLQGKRYQGASNIYKQPGLMEIAGQILASPGDSYRYQHNGQEVLLNTRFVPELNWYLLVEQVRKPAAKIQSTLWVNLSFSLIITLIVMLIVNMTIGKYQQRLELMATRDNLTGAYNRHAFEDTFLQALRTAERRQEPLSIAIVDIDDFKAINDRYGHLAGDAVIRSIAETLRAELRDSDIICRWGGEEFLLLLPCCDAAAAELLARHLCQAISDQVITWHEHSISTSASFGLSSYQFGESQADLFNRADQALYRAKENGKNSIEVG
ncbi:GGDEF domain-containing protein [Parahaliea sp. F7430]|uniref:diguanylate cyclase n=1 Tax=Sediminihaliea albiluteola TaxID=2758564 RepID=A0A7W2TUF6_9GAMM|nr:sensor domain-containing diguanylate cyclase [Sediminihaliea albiluteola]MBA6412075.1 GGDEF domain-containing protein [Sediminihaliea albiluteola]